MNNDKNLDRVRFLDGKRIFITPQSVDDFDFHYRWDHDLEQSFLDSRPLRAIPYEKAKKAFEERINRDDVMAFCIILKEMGEHIGIVELYDIDDYEHKCHWGIALDKRHWRHGFGTEAAHLIIKYVFNDLGFRRLKSYTHSGNPGSMIFQEKLGFTKEAVLRKESTFSGQFYDCIIYGMLKEEFNQIYEVRS
ncbi:MAG: GNAT family protein [Candidatus Zixiibacteriota bacterium]